MDWKKVFTNFRILMLIAFIVFSIVAISPHLSSDGVAIRYVEKNSSASIAGILSPDASIRPMQREVIKSINNIPIHTEDDFYEVTSNLEINKTYTIVTKNKKIYRVIAKPLIEETVLNETEFINVTNEVFNETTNETINVTEILEIQKIDRKVIGVEDLGIKISPVATNNIRKGLDLEGGTRVLLQPDTEVSDEDLDLVIDNIKQRLNVYGVSDVVVRSTKDFTGEVYVLVEIAGVSQEEIRDLLSNQGKFEAKVGDITVFRGGQDIKYVDRSATGSGIDPRRGCQPSAEGYFCSFRFGISLDPAAAQRQADATANLLIVPSESGGEGYLNESLLLYLDDELVDELKISSGLRGNAVTEISISGGSSGSTQQEAVQNTLDSMKQLQTVLITGSLPVKMNIINVQTISPLLGKEFTQNAFLVGLLSMITVIIVVIIRYKKMFISVPMIVAMLSEVIIIFGFAALIGWRMDLAAIAGIIVAVGTGVDDQIVIVDETLHSKKKEYSSWKDKLSKAFFIIMAAYFTTVVAMLPLYATGAGLLKGFALTTIVGVSIGVLITRPAFAAIMEMLIKKDD